MNRQRDALLVCNCLPLPDGANDCCPIHGEDAPCDCGHPLHAHDESGRHDLCGSCSCIRFNPALDPDPNR